jgi:predicted ATP-grasp superfamily ATP-dependent carboligase
MIGYEQALAVCRTDPEAAARLLCEFSSELDQLKAEVATLKAENSALRRSLQTQAQESAPAQQSALRSAY